MKNTKRRLEPLSFFNHTGISRHLEKMAAKGWMIEKNRRLWRTVLQSRKLSAQQLRTLWSER